MDVIHTPTKMGYDRLQLCKQIDMKVWLWIGAHPNHFYFH